VLNLGLEHLGLIFIVNVTMELLKRRGLNTDYAPYVAIALGCLLVVSADDLAGPDNRAHT